MRVNHNTNQGRGTRHSCCATPHCTVMHSNKLHCTRQLDQSKPTAKTKHLTALQRALSKAEHTPHAFAQGRASQREGNLRAQTENKLLQSRVSFRSRRGRLSPWRAGDERMWQKLVNGTGGEGCAKGPVGQAFADVLGKNYNVPQMVALVFHICLFSLLLLPFRTLRVLFYDCESHAVYSQLYPRQLPRTPQALNGEKERLHFPLTCS